MAELEALGKLRWKKIATIVAIYFLIVIIFLTGITPFKNSFNNMVSNILFSFSYWWFLPFIFPGVGLVYSSFLILNKSRIESIIKLGKKKKRVIVTLILLSSISALFMVIILFILGGSGIFWVAVLSSVKWLGLFGLGVIMLNLNSLIEKMEIKFPKISALKTKALFASYLILAGSLWFIAQQPLPLVITCGPYLTAPTESSMSVIWITNYDSIGWVEYGETPGLGSIEYETEAGLREDSNLRIHKIRLTGLLPGEEYYYQIHSQRVNKIMAYSADFGREISGELHSFKTFDSAQADASFAVLSDLHENGDWFYTFQDEIQESADFVVLNGDFISEFETENQLIRSILKPATDAFASEIPLVMVRGNHETRGALARSLGDYFDSPSGDYYYTFKHGPAGFLVMDTGEDKSDENFEYSGLVDFSDYRDVQTQWLNQTYASLWNETINQQIALMHNPLSPEIILSEEIEEWRVYQQQWATLLNEGGCDVLLSGHWHRNSIINATLGATDFPVIVSGGHANADDYTILIVNVNTTSIDYTYQYKQSVGMMGSI